MAVFECEKNPERSLVALEDALARQPNQINLLLANGARLLKVARAGEAEKAYALAAEILPSSGRAWVGLAMAREALGDDAGAARACRKALEVEPDLQPARLYCSAPR